MNVSVHAQEPAAANVEINDLHSSLQERKAVETRVEVEVSGSDKGDQRWKVEEANMVMKARFDWGSGEKVEGPDGEVEKLSTTRKASEPDG
ncbi:hypothetical protein AAF712_010743 [Marasmius tenuissimus]|uniref:Uncharacterized protein n=1 Tax=Marasmius tenuissimus TaxID=585030 RepID=A0ABR2ZPT3_9AGAR